VFHELGMQQDVGMQQNCIINQLSIKHPAYQFFIMHELHVILMAKMTIVPERVVAVTL